ncbi:DUF7878 domain-containing protein [Bacillus sp. FJAT-27231]|uniref:DUF7878 domain-containing protein n=1 Tax=Bacillus sp. FJAT-27231 TaxID=1679168 RepID=UPI003FA4B7D7
MDQQVFFEESVALLEFYLYLDRWVNSLNQAKPDRFDYFTMEIEEEPLISAIFYNGLGRI